MSAKRKTREPPRINEPLDEHLDVIPPNSFTTDIKPGVQKNVTPEHKLRLVEPVTEPVSESMEEEPPVKNATQEEPRFKETDHEPHLIDNQKNMDIESRSVSRKEKKVFAGSLWIWIALVLALSAIPLLNFLVIPVLVVTGAAVFVVYGIIKTRKNNRNSDLK